MANYLIMDIERIKTKFRDSFDFEANGFINPVYLTDSKIGFSVQKKPEFKLLGLLGVDSDKEYITLIHIYIPEKEMEMEESKKPLVIRASFHLYRDEKFYIDDSHIPNKRRKPIDLVSRDEYYYVIESGKFFDKKNKEVSANEILNQVYELHIKPSKFWKGLFLRSKMHFKNLKAFLIKLFSNFLASILFLINGTKVTENILARYYDDDKSMVMGNRSVTDAKESPKTTIFGYSAHIRPLISYSILHLFIFIFFFFKAYKPELIKLVFTNNFLTVLYVVVSLSFFESLLPKILLRLIKWTTDLHMRILFKEIKI